MAQYVLQPVGHDPYDATPVNGDPFGMAETPGALPLTSQEQASRMVDQGTRALTPFADSLGSAASLLGRALYGPEAAGWDRYGPAKPEEALNAAGWVTMPGLGRAAVALPAERGLGEVLSSSGIKPPVMPAPEGLGPSLTAYHASPHDFEKPDISKIGTGEGGQAFGHGLYSAESKAVSGRGGQYDKMFTAQNLGQSGGLTAQQEYVLKALGQGKSDLEILSGMARDGFASDFDQAQSVLDQIHANKAHIYEWKINADPEHFLDWDKPLNEQSPKVQEALQLPPVAQRLNDRMIANGNPGMTVGNAYAEMRAAGMDAADVSKKLRDAGIPGIKYLDAGSRAPPVAMDNQIATLQQQIDAYAAMRQHDPMADQSIAPLQDKLAQLKAQRAAYQPTRNFVTFSDDIISILKKYGLAGLGIGTGAAARQEQPDRSQ